MEIHESAVRQVANLKIGEAFSRSKIVLEPSPRAIRGTKRELMQLLSPVIARAQKVSFGAYRLHTVHAFTRDYTVVVSGVIVREPEARQLTMADILARCGCNRLSCDGILTDDNCYVKQLINDRV